jgi:prevent-host-death family protein
MREMNAWTLEGAKNKLSEVVRLALDHQPQLVVRGRRTEESVVVVARSDYERLLAPMNLVDFLQSSPLAAAIAAESEESTAALFERPRDFGRDIEF